MSQSDDELRQILVEFASSPKDQQGLIVPEAFDEAIAKIRASHIELLSNLKKKMPKTIDSTGGLWPGEAKYNKVIDQCAAVLAAAIEKLEGK